MITKHRDSAPLKVEIIILGVLCQELCGSVSLVPILGDPGADSGGEGKALRRFFFFVARLDFPSPRLSAPPWVSEDVSSPVSETFELPADEATVTCDVNFFFRGVRRD